MNNFVNKFASDYEQSSTKRQRRPNGYRRTNQALDKVFDVSSANDERIPIEIVNIDNETLPEETNEIIEIIDSSDDDDNDDVELVEDNIENNRNRIFSLEFNQSPLLNGFRNDSFSSAEQSDEDDSLTVESQESFEVEFEEDNDNNTDHVVNVQAVRNSYQYWSSVQEVKIIPQFKFNAQYGTRKLCIERLQEQNVMLILWNWCHRVRKTTIAEMVGCSVKSVSAVLNDWYQMLQEDISLNDCRIGGIDSNGQRIIVEINESKFGKRKYNRGGRVEGVWAVGGVERTAERQCFLVTVNDRSTETMNAIIEKYVLEGSIVHTDRWLC
ncbi:hypothetical protein G6F56_011251 [Rhizopus delemar]|nr:hypothetical protein G6F56_011251 [Rhizopus delemar]